MLSRPPAGPAVCDARAICSGIDVRMAASTGFAAVGRCHLAALVEGAVRIEVGHRAAEQAGGGRWCAKDQGAQDQPGGCLQPGHVVDAAGIHAQAIGQQGVAEPEGRT